MIPDIEKIAKGDARHLARAITIVENKLPGWQQLLESLPAGRAGVVGITGPPGAGKSTLVNALLAHWLAAGKKVAVLAVDPSSPFNLGALLGDRIRMNDFYTHPNAFIRSLASRGALGGLSNAILEITDVVRAADFDFVIIETVGIGQSEVEIAALADCTVLALVPEAGDVVQTMKAGVMEIADVFVINKADRDGSEALYKTLQRLVHEHAGRTPVLKTTATDGAGIPELAQAVESELQGSVLSEKRIWLLTEKCWRLIQELRMADLDKKLLAAQLTKAATEAGFNLYGFVRRMSQRPSAKAPL